MLVAVPAVRALAGWDAPSLHLPWPVPLGSFSLGVDALSGFFVLVVALLGALAAVYGVGYLAHAAAHRHLGVPWCFYNLLLASMLVVVRRATRCSSWWPGRSCRWPRSSS